METKINKNKRKIKKLNLKRSLYRGILTEIAAEQNVSVPAVWESVQVYRNPRIMAIFDKKVKERKKTIRRVENMVGVA
jgi:hypothetical protein